jgi:hypothetical protein
VEDGGGGGVNLEVARVVCNVAKQRRAGVSRRRELFLKVSFYI